jgi:hypothetical protein
LSKQKSLYSWLQNYVIHELKIATIPDDHSVRVWSISAGNAFKQIDLILHDNPAMRVGFDVLYDQAEDAAIHIVGRLLGHCDTSSVLAIRARLIGKEVMGVRHQAEN